MAVFTVVGGTVLGACGGAEYRAKVPLAPGQRVEVTYLDADHRLTLRDVDSVDQAAYSKGGLYGQVSPDMKLADRESMQMLVDALHELGHFDRAQPTKRADAKVALQVRLGDRLTVWSQPPLQPENMSELERFNTARLAVLQLHNNIISFHTSRMSSEDFDRAIAEQQAKNRESMRNVLEKARGRSQ